jgi:hypothetical protein
MIGFIATLVLFYGLSLVPITCAGFTRAGPTVTLCATATTIGMLIAVGLIYRVIFGGAELNMTIPIWISGTLALLSIIAGVRLIRRNG